MMLFTPLEAFKTDIFRFYEIFLAYPFIISFQANAFVVSIIILIIGLGSSSFLLNEISHVIYFRLAEFFNSYLSLRFSRYFVSFVSLTMIIAGFNVLGLIPFSSTFTAQLLSNLMLTFSLILGLVVIGFNLDGIRFLQNFIPKNVPIFLIPLLFFIEILSFLMRIFSMSIRLFSNMVAGHSLLHLINQFVDFCVVLASGYTVFIIIVLIPLGISYFWIIFELFIAFLQAYVFVLLYLLYLADLEKTH